MRFAGVIRPAHVWIADMEAVCSCFPTGAFIIGDHDFVCHCILTDIKGIAVSGIKVLEKRAAWEIRRSRKLYNNTA